MEKTGWEEVASAKKGPSAQVLTDVIIAFFATCYFCNCNTNTQGDYKEFQQRAACVVDQFNHYPIEGGMNHNGKLVLGESIGDLGGLRLAYLALEKSLEGKPRENVDGFTQEQQFFIAWGQTRGDEVRPERQRQMVLTDSHPIGKYRVIGPMSNMPEFQKGFSCKEGDPMVRPAEKKCQIW